MKSTSIRLTDEEDTILTQLAAKMKCHSRYGATSGQPSWRVMLQHLAEGRLIISNPLDKTRQLFINFKRPPGWWKPDEKESMAAADVAKKYKTTVEILEEKGFVVDGDRIYAGNWKGWRAPAAAPATKAANSAPPLDDAEEVIDPATTPEPTWFERPPSGAAVMLLADATKASGMSEGAMKDLGYRTKTTNGKRYLTGPVGSCWDVDAPDPESPEPPSAE